MATPGTRRYGGLDPVERAEARRRRLLDAALEVFARQGWAGATVRAICAEAHLSQSNFYEAYTGREELFAALQNEIAAQAADVLTDSQRAVSGDASARVRAAFEALVGFFEADRRRATVALVESAATEEFRARRRRAFAAFARLAASLVRDFYGDALRDDADLDLATFTVVSGVAETLAAWCQGVLDVEPARLARRLSDVFLAVIEAEVSAPNAPPAR